MRCQNCQEEIVGYGKKFCSFGCYTAYKKLIFDKKYTKKCVICNKEFRCPTTNPQKKTCSSDCLSVLLKMRVSTTESNEKRSKTLKLHYSVHIHHNSGMITSEETKIKMRQSCKGVNKGANNGNWRNGASRTQFRGEEWKELRKQVYERDNWKCQKCGQKRKLYAHHIIPWRESRDNNLDNIITLCRSCHTSEDNKIIKREKEENNDKMSRLW